MKRQPDVAVSAIIAVTVTMTIASMSYAGAVSAHALVGFELPVIVIGVAIAATFIRHRVPGLAVGVGVAAALGWSEIANIATGETNGPAARSALIIGSGTVVALAMLATRFPGAFLVPVAGVVLGAMLLGAGGEVRVVALATAFAAVVALAIVERTFRRFAPPPAPTRTARPWSVPTACVIVAAVAAILAVTQARHDGREPHAAIGGIANSQIRPAWPDPFGAPKALTAHTTTPSSTTTTTTTAIARPLRPPHPHRHQHQRKRHRGRWWVLLLLLAIAALFVIAVAAVLVRYFLVRRSWRMLRSRLRERSASESVEGAWVWARHRLAACRRPLPLELSPEAVATSQDQVPQAVVGPLSGLAQLIVPVAFAAVAAGEEDVAAAWAFADEVDTDALSDLRRLQRFRASFTSPTAVTWSAP